MQLPPRPSQGEPIRAEWGNRVVDYLKAITGRSSATVRVSLTPGGTTYEALPPGPKGAVAETTHPYKVFTRPHPLTAGTYQARVEYRSPLMRARRWTDVEPITGLSTHEPDGAVQEESWFPLIPADAIWLEYSRTGGIPAANIRSWGKADEWHSWPAEVETSGNDYISRFLIAYTLPGADGAPVLHQCLREGLLLVTACSGGRTVLFPQPYTLPYTSL